MSSNEGSSGAGEKEDPATDRQGREFPHADAIVIPADVKLEEEDPRPAMEPRESPTHPDVLTRVLGRTAAWFRTLLDRVLLVLTFVVPPLILAWQSFEWLRSSVWPPMPVARPFHWLQLDVAGHVSGAWPGLSRLLEWVLGAPLVAVLFVGGFALHLLLGVLFPRVGRG